MGQIVAYAVRASGMVIVFGFCLMLLFASLSRGGNVVTTAACVVVLASAVLSWPRLPDAWRRDPPTERQLAYAQSLGILVPPGVSKGELSDLISQATGR